MTKNINIYIISSDELKNRINNINNVISVLKNLCNKNNVIASVNLISEPSSTTIDKNINVFNNRVDYNKFDETNEYNEYIIMLNSCQISNYEKHRELYNIIKDKNNDELHMIIEDDILVSNSYMDNIEEMIRDLTNKDSSSDLWDILFLSLNTVKNGENLINYREVYNKLITKSCYFIKPKICNKLYEESKTFKLQIKYFLSKYIDDNKDVKVYFYNKNTLIEGTKIGFYPSSVNSTNYLYFNNEYIELLKIHSKEEIIDEDVNNAYNLYKNVENMNSSDIINIMGMIYKKHKNYSEAKKYFIKALDIHRKNYGYLQKNSNILNNCITIFQYEQDMLEECLKVKPKY
jgi:GR25 family glycosyltransferase involved in LPS biosynthesis